MNSTKHTYSQSQKWSSAQENASSFLGDLAELFKLRLSFLVVFSSVLGAVIVGGLSVFTFSDFVLLFIGGLLTSGSGSAVNQVLEKDVDKLMKRTHNRPLAKDSISVPKVLLIIGLSLCVGLTLLYFLHPMAAIFSMVAWALYGFVYTPMKKMGPFAVFIGAIPGALPVLIGTVAVEGQISFLAFLLFSIQFIWQFPHFWAIAWISDTDYKKAGFRLLPNVLSSKDESVAWQCLVYATLLIPISLVFWYNGFLGYVGLAVFNIFNLAYIFYAYKLYDELSDEAAKNLMFSSFFYLPLVLLSLSFLIIL